MCYLPCIVTPLAFYTQPSGYTRYKMYKNTPVYIVCLCTCYRRLAAAAVPETEAHPDRLLAVTAATAGESVRQEPLRRRAGA